MGIVRLLLALSVVLWHTHGTPVRMFNGAVAVVLFFMISGFYMAMIINEKYAKGEKAGWISTFYMSRAWRLFPAYWATLALMVLWYIGTNGPNPFTLQTDVSMLNHVLLMIPNLFIVGQDWHQFITRVVLNPAGPQWLIDLFMVDGKPTVSNFQMAVGHAWSLSAEISFYLLAPFIVRSARRTFIVAAAALLLRFILLTVFEQPGGVWGYYLFPGSFSMFMLGAASYHLHQLMPRRDLHKRIGAIALTVFLVWVVVMVLKHRVILESPGGGSIDRARFWVLYILFAFFMPFVFSLSKDVAGLRDSDAPKTLIDYIVHWERELGELSYSLYLIHGIVVGIIYHRWNAPPGQPADMILAVLLSLLAAALLRHYVEKPAENMRRKWAGARLQRPGSSQ